MDDIIDLTGSDAEHDVLTTTEAGGIFGGKLLNEEPIESYLDGEESVQWVIRNKKSGLTITGESSEETVEPGGDYQALAVVTDRRILYIVGMDEGNETRSVEMEDIFDARSESAGFRTTAFKIETIEGETWSFPAKSDVEPVVDTADAIAQAWVSALRLLDEAEAALSSGLEAVPADEVAGRAALETVTENLRLAREEIEPAGAVGKATVEKRTSELRPKISPLRRQVRAGEAAANHAQAQTAWANGEYEAAAIAYEEAVNGYRDALAADGTTPATERLQSRYRGALSERELLRAGPLADADTIRRQAQHESSAATAATLWQQALGRYRQAVSLEWPDADRSFLADPAIVRDQIEAVADDAITDSYDAGRELLEAGDDDAIGGEPTVAFDRYQEALDLFEQAGELAAEVRPDYLDVIDTALATADQRVAGNLPGEPDQPVVPPLEPEDEVPDEEAMEPATPEEVTDDGDGEDEDGSVIDQIRSNKATSAGESQAATVEGVAGEESTTVDESGFEWQSGTGGTTAEAREAAARGRQEGDVSEQERTVTEDETDRAPLPEPETEIGAALLELDPVEFTEFIADLWEARGWSTDTFTQTGASVYDVVAIQAGDETARLLLWTVHRPAGGEVDSTTIKRCATGRDSSQGAVSATVVTTGRLTPTAERLAEERDVTYVDRPTLVEFVEEQGMAEELERRT